MVLADLRVYPAPLQVREEALPSRHSALQILRAMEQPVLITPDVFLLRVMLFCIKLFRVSVYHWCRKSYSAANCIICVPVIL